MYWETIIVLCLGLLVNLCFNYYTNSEMLESTYNKLFYLFIWVITACVTILANLASELNPELMLIFYLTVGVSIPQIGLIITKNKEYKKKESELNEKISSLEGEKNNLSRQYDSLDSDLKIQILNLKTEKNNLCMKYEREMSDLNKKYDTLYGNVSMNVYTSDKDLIYEYCNLFKKHVDNADLENFFMKRCINFGMFGILDDKG